MSILCAGKSSNLIVFSAENIFKISTTTGVALVCFAFQIVHSPVMEFLLLVIRQEIVGDVTEHRRSELQITTRGVFR